MEKKNLYKERKCYLYLFSLISARLLLCWIFDVIFDIGIRYLILEIDDDVNEYMNE